MHSTLARLATLIAVLIGSAFVGALPAQAIVDRDCADFDSQRQAQIFFLRAGGPDRDPHRLDADGDGVVCESNGSPYYYGNTPPDSGGQSGPTTVKTSVAFSVSRTSAIAGESVRMSAKVKPRGVRRVTFQRKAGRQWRVVERDRTNRRGVAKHVIRAPRSRTVYRAVVSARKAGNKRYTAATSGNRTLRVTQQSVWLAMTASSVSQHDWVTGTAQATPVRRGRTVSLQARRDGVWREISTGFQNRYGETVFDIPTNEAGTHTYRAVVHRAGGAAAVASTTSNLTVWGSTL